MSQPQSAANFDQLQERWRLVGRIVTRTGLHIGGGADHERATCGLPVLCDRDGLPIIPGSSLKGTLRATAESLLRAVGASGLDACDPLDERRSSCGATAARPGPGRGGAGAPAATRCCAVCSVFGARGIASHVRFSDASLSERGASAPIELREGVAIDRDLGTALAARRYELELVAPGTAFELELFADNAEPWMLGLVAAGLDQLDQGFASLGGFASRGLGRVAIEYRSLERATARSILAGDAPERFEGEALGGALAGWRQALRARADAGEA